MSPLRASVTSCGRRAAEYLDRKPRTRTCLLGKLVYRGGAYSVDCAIRNLSEGGAKVTLEQRQFLPVELYLIVVRNRVVHEAKIVWLNFPARGLKFINTQSLLGELPQDIRFVRKLWDAWSL